MSLVLSAIICFPREVAGKEGCQCSHGVTVRHHGTQPKRQVLLQSPSLCLLQGGRCQGTCCPAPLHGATCGSARALVALEAPQQTPFHATGTGSEQEAKAAPSHSVSVARPHTSPRLARDGHRSPGTPSTSHCPMVSPGAPAHPAHHEHEDGQQLRQALPQQLVPDVEQSPGPVQEGSGAHGASWEWAAVTMASCLCPSAIL